MTTERLVADRTYTFRRGLRRWAVKARDSVRKLMLQVASRNAPFAMVYYGFINREFLREEMAVAAGQLHYAKLIATGAANFYQLRRNIHRIEKGLIMRPRRNLFAAEYITETIELYTTAVAACDDTNKGEVIWAHDVLTEYFNAVDRNHPVLEAAYRRFSCLANFSDGGRNVRSVPYARDLSSPSPVRYADFLALSQRRRSVRWFRDEPVPRQLIEMALEAAAQAPTACNRQPVVFRIFDDRELTQKVGSIPMGTKGFSDQIPVLAVLVGQLRAYPYERDRHAIYVDGALSAMSFIYALETLGLSSCVINWPDQEPHETRMRQTLGLADDERVILLIALGWPDESGMVPFSAKRNVNQLRTFNDC